MTIPICGNLDYSSVNLFILKRRSITVKEKVIAHLLFYKTVSYLLVSSSCPHCLLIPSTLTLSWYTAILRSFHNLSVSTELPKPYIALSLLSKKEFSQLVLV